jgi:hypothetical protein
MNSVEALSGIYEQNADPMRYRESDAKCQKQKDEKIIVRRNRIASKCDLRILISK